MGSQAVAQDVDVAGAGYPAGHDRRDDVTHSAAHGAHVLDGGQVAARTTKRAPVHRHHVAIFGGQVCCGK